MAALPRGWKLAAGASALVIGLVAISLLAIRGVPGPRSPAPTAAQPAQPVPQTAPGLDVMAQRLAARLEATGSADAGDWELLARSYVELRRPADALKPFAQARKLRGDGDAQLLADYADALLASNGGQVDARVRELVANALKADPANAKARALATGLAPVQAPARSQNQTQTGTPGVPATAPSPAAASGAEPSWMPQSMKGPKAAGR